jgi:hypothetical protein
MNPSTPLVRCGGCGEPPLAGRPLRRGRCERCYDAWVKARPVGIGAACAGCDNRRRVHLRHYELSLATNAPSGRWLVLCHNCVAVAEKLQPPPRSIEGLKMRLQRDRRWGDRRAESVGRPSVRDGGNERRAGDRRQSARDLIDATDLLIEEEELVIEMEADYELVLDEPLPADAASDEITGIHFRI